MMRCATRRLVLGKKRWTAPARCLSMTMSTRYQADALPLLQSKAQSESDLALWTTTTMKRQRERPVINMAMRKPAKPMARESTQRVRIAELSSSDAKTTRHILPRGPKGLISSPKQFLGQKWPGITDGKISFNVHRTSSRDRTGSFLYEATVVASMPNQPTMKTLATSTNKVAAEREAALRFVALLHSKGLVEQLWPTPETISPEVAAKEKDALKDVYNYCLAHMVVPQVTIQKPAELRAFKYFIHLPEQDISVLAVAKTLVSAELAAAVKFKAAAEAYVGKLGLENLVIKDGNSLSADNADKFHEWLKMRRPSYGCVTEVVIKANYCEAQVFSKGQSGERLPLSPLVHARGKQDAEKLAFLCAAINIIRTDEDSTLLQEFNKALKEGNGRIMHSVKPITLDVPQESLDMMIRTMKKHRSWSSVALADPDVQSAAVSEHPRQQAPLREVSQEQKHHLSVELAAMHKRYLTSDDMAPMRSIKANLPMNQHKQEVCQLVQDNIYSIVIGATGSGKTTQVPQIILEQYYQNGNGADCNIICTQPRRIAARSVARRVADEMGPELKAHVGYHVRFEARLPRPGGSVTYCTTGILLQQLQTDPDRIFDRVSHLIIDEVHERDKIIDFTLSILKRAVAERLSSGKKVPKITLMSATLDTELFANYFQNLGPDGEQTPAPVLSVPGRTFPVAEQHLTQILAELREKYSSRELQVLEGDRDSQEYLRVEKEFAHGAGPSIDGPLIIDWNAKPTGSVGNTSQDALTPCGLIASTIAHVLKTTTDGAVLVFLPGLAEMQRVETLMMKGPVLGVDLSDTTKYSTYLLHSSIPDAQKTVFQPVAHPLRKVILSTNIGETSITIPDVKHVIDTGKVRETQYDHVKRISALQTAWISKSSAKQRAGRAGRVQNGQYLALFTKERQQSMRAVGLPELLRSDLQTTCLDIKSSIPGVYIAEFLAASIEPPSPESVREAIHQLIGLGALTPSQDLTALGKLLSSLPVHPALGKMMVLGVLFRCLDPILVIGASVEERGLFITAPDVKAASLARKTQISAGSESDHLAVYNTFNLVRERYNPNDSQSEYAASHFARQNYVHFGAFKSIYGGAKQIEQILREAGLIPDESSKPFYSRSPLFGGRDLNMHSGKPHIVKAILLAGMQPNIAISTHPESQIWRSADQPIALLPQSSVMAKVRPRRTKSNGRVDSALVTFTNIVKSADGASTFLRDASIVSPLAVVLFSSKMEAPTADAAATANNWLPFYIKGEDMRSWSATSVVMRFRRLVDTMLASTFKSLASLHNRERGTDDGHGNETGMHDDAMRSQVSEAVVDVLDAAEMGRDRRERRERREAGVASSTVTKRPAYKFS